MKRTFKWILIIGGGLIVLLIAAFILIPEFVDVNKYKPQIEAEIARVTGRSVTLGGDLRLSLFPWAGLSFSDLHLGSLPGFKEKDFITVKSFDVRAKFIPLLFKDIQVKRFILKGARVVLETRKDGRVNWEFKRKGSSKVKKPVGNRPSGGLALKALSVGEFAITDGSILWLDHKTKNRKEMTDVALHLQDISLDRPVRLKFSAHLDSRPISIQGVMGPIGQASGKGTIPLDFSAKLLQEIKIGLKGNVTDPAIRPKYNITIQVSPFSPRKLLAALGKDFPLMTSDPKAVGRMSFKGDIKGDTGKISVSNGVMNLDESKMNFSIKAGNFSKPSVAFNCDLDNIDMDRYLPPSSQKKGGAKEPKAASAAVKHKTDYSMLRKITVNGSMHIGKLKVKDAEIENVRLKIIGEKGIFKLRPLTMALYQGDVSGSGMFSVQKDLPRINIQLTLEGVNAGPLFVDVFKKDFFEGNLKAQFNLTMRGDDAKRIKKTLGGKGDLLFKDGAIKGIDLAGMMNNVKTAFGPAENSGEVPRTDFSELHVPFTVKKGLVNTAKSSLISPLIRLTAAGNADLNRELLDFRLEPKLVATFKGQGDSQERSGLMVPVLVTGGFSAPKFRPDLQGIIKQKIEKSLPDLQKQLLQGDTQKRGSGDVGEKIKGILKGLGY